MKSNKLSSFSNFLPPGFSQLGNDKLRACNSCLLPSAVLCVANKQGTLRKCGWKRSTAFWHLGNLPILHCGFSYPAATANGPRPRFQGLQGVCFPLYCGYGFHFTVVNRAKKKKKTCSEKIVLNRVEAVCTLACVTQMLYLNILNNNWCLRFLES